MKYDDWSLYLNVKRKIYKEDIIEAGLELIHHYGYNGVSIKDITEKVGIPKGSFYNHFESKSVFLKTVIDFYAEQGFELIKEHLLNVKTSPVNAIKNYFNVAVDFYGSNENRNGCLIGNTCQELGNVDPAIQKHVELKLGGAKEILGDLLKQAHALGEVNLKTDPYDTAEFITNSWQGALLRMKSTGNNTPLKTFQTILLTQLLTK